MKCQAFDVLYDLMRQRLTTYGHADGNRENIGSLYRARQETVIALRANGRTK